MNILKEIYHTEGRLNRLKFLKYYLGVTVMGASATFVTSCMATFLTGDPNGSLVNMVTTIWAIAASVGAFMLIIRRLHDLNKSGWYILITFVPLIGLIFLIYLFFAPGQIGWNKYGADPLDDY